MGMSDEFIRWYSTRYGLKPTKQQADQSVGLWTWALKHRTKLTSANQGNRKVENKYIQQRRKGNE